MEGRFPPTNHEAACLESGCRKTCRRPRGVIGLSRIVHHPGKASYCAIQRNFAIEYLYITVGEKSAPNRPLIIKIAQKQA
jgi:hypothetical protein